MTTDSTEKAAKATDMSVPTPLVLDRLRDHFRRTYMLNETQVETMLISSSKSLNQALASAHDILEGTEPEARFTLIFHSLKGLLLNMGEAEWAAYTKELEKKLTDGEQVDYAAAVEVLEKGLAVILSYTEGMAEQAKHGGTSGGERNSSTTG